MSTQVTKADALQRAVRTLWQGFGTDALVAIGAGLVLLLGDVEVTTTAFWAALGVLILKSFLTALASYLQRLKNAPKPVEPVESKTASIVTLAPTHEWRTDPLPEPDYPPFSADPNTPIFNQVQNDHRP